MAPSPTGEYHIGHIRTLLYNWVYARKNKGKFIIRIEDTDRERYIEGATEAILNVISEYGFDWDEGPKVGGSFEPYIQSERLEIYKKYASQLVDKGKAYYCFCTEERLKQMREEQRENGIASTKYDRLCLKLDKSEVEANLKENKPHVIRLKVPEDENIKFSDLVFGEISVNSNDLDDQVLIKSDGFPTYHMAVVIDDHLMEITHVMRGNDWIPSTPKHVILYKAFNWKMPIFIHLPNLKELGAAKKLSKRFGPVSAKEFLEQGYLPEALINFLMFLGWNPGTEKEMYSLEEFIKDFSIEKIHKTDLVAFDRQKLEWMNSQYIKKLSDEEFAERSLKFAPEGADKKILVKFAPLIKSRIKTLSELEEFIGFFFEQPKVDKKMLGNNWKKHLEVASRVIEKISAWTLEDLNNSLTKEIEKNNFKISEFFMDLRVSITGKKITPPINDSIVLLGKKETLERLKNIIS